MERKDINKHLQLNDTANTLAYKAIKLDGAIKKDGVTFDYDKDNNILTMSDGITATKFRPLITDSEIDPFYELIEVTNDDEDFLYNHWLFQYD